MDSSFAPGSIKYEHPSQLTQTGMFQVQLPELRFATQDFFEIWEDLTLRAYLSELTSTETTPPESDDHSSDSENAAPDNFQYLKEDLARIEQEIASKASGNPVLSMEFLQPTVKAFLVWIATFLDRLLRKVENARFPSRLVLDAFRRLHACLTVVFPKKKVTIGCVSGVLVWETRYPSLKEALVNIVGETLEKLLKWIKKDTSLKGLQKYAEQLLQEFCRLNSQQFDTLNLPEHTTYQNRGSQMPYRHIVNQAATAHQNRATELAPTQQLYQSLDWSQVPAGSALPWFGNGAMDPAETGSENNGQSHESEDVDTDQHDLHNSELCAKQPASSIQPAGNPDTEPKSLTAQTYSDKDILTNAGIGGVEVPVVFSDSRLKVWAAVPQKEM